MRSIEKRRCRVNAIRIRAQIDCHELANRDVHPESVHTAPEGLDRPEKIGSPIDPNEYRYAFDAVTRIDVSGEKVRCPRTLGPWQPGHGWALTRSVPGPH